MFIPITHSLEAMRLSMLKGYSVHQISDQLIVLAAITVVLLPSSLIIFERAVIKGKKEGTLISY